MISVQDVIKKFDGTAVLEGIQMEIPKGGVYGIVGSNGAGKSTLLRLLCGVYKSDGGSIVIEGLPVYNNPEAKAKIAFVPDELFFLPHADLNRMVELYCTGYKAFDKKEFYTMANLFELDTAAKISTFSKGMKRQAATILALSCMTDYVLFDETFDGLDPVMRNLVRKVLYARVCERRLTAVITSHSLRELEDTCDRLALLHQGKIVLESDVESLKTSVFKVQAAFDFEYDQSLFSSLDISQFAKNGSVCTFILKGSEEEATRFIQSKSPKLFEIVPLNLEEVFIHEMAVLGYSYEDLIV